MTNSIDGKGVTVSVKIYERLLAAYPADFRREYGPAMKQVFRDQCRDAWSRAQGRGLAVLWLRVAPDLARTSLVEHLTNLHHRQSMCRKILRAFRIFCADAGLRAVFGKWFALAFLCMFAFSICQMFWTPKVYSSTARITVENDPPVIESGRSDSYFLTTQFKVIASYNVLTNVIATLHLNQKLAAQAGEADWTTDQAYANLFHEISVKSTRLTNLIEISVKNRDPKLAADIANAIVDAYRGSRLEKWKGDCYSGINALETKLSENEPRLANMETKLNELRAALGTTDLDEESLRASVPIETEQLREYQREETKARTDYLEYSNILAGIATIPKYELGHALATAYAHQSDPELSALSARLTEAKDKATAAQSSLGANHPEYRVAQTLLIEAQYDYDNKVNGIITGLKERVAIDKNYVQIMHQLKMDLETKRNLARDNINLKSQVEELKRNNEGLNRTIQKEVAAMGQPLKSMVIMRDPARPIMRPIQSMSDIFTKWMLGGTLAALAAGGAGTWLAYGVRRLSQRPPTPS